MEIIKNIIKLISNVGMLVYYNMNRIICEIAFHSHIEEKHSTAVNSKYSIREEPTHKIESLEDNEEYRPYNGPYCETP